MAFVVSPNVLSVLFQTKWETLFWCYVFGAMWGVGGLTWGLMIRYLGVGLGLALGCGVCASVGTLAPPIFRGELPSLAGQDWGIAILVGIGIGVLGIILTGAAGMSKERELSDEQKKAAVAEFHFSRGIVVALFSGVMSAGMAFGLGAGKEIERAALHTQPATDADLAGHPRARRRAVGRLHRQFSLVPVSQFQEPQRRRLHQAWGPAGRQCALCQRRWRHLVLAIRHLQSRRRQERPAFLCRLDDPDVQHGHLQHAARDIHAASGGA